MSRKSWFLILLFFPLFSAGQFVARFDVESVSEFNDSTWTLQGNLIDLTGSWNASEVDTGYKIVQRGVDTLGKVVFDRWKIIEVLNTGETYLSVMVRSDGVRIKNNAGMPGTGSFPIGAGVGKLTYKASWYQAQIDPDYESGIDNLNLQEVNVQINEPEADPIYAADSGFIKDTLISHNTRINQRVRSITATSPVISSGGYTPNISIDTTILITRYDTLNFATITEVNTRDTLVKKYTRDRFRTMSNHDSLSRLDERSYESLTSKPVLTVTQDLPYSSVITLDSSDIILTAEQYNTLRQIGNEILIGTDTSNIITRYDTAGFATYTETIVRDTLVKQYARGRFRTMSNHDSLSMLDEKSYNSLTDKPTTWAWNNITGVPAAYTPTTISISGDVSGSGQNSISATLTTVTVARSGLNSITTDAKGRVISGATINYLTSIAWPSTYTPTVHNHDHDSLTNYVSQKHFYQKSIDTVNTALTGLAKVTSGKLSTIADNSGNWNAAYGWGNHVGLYFSKTDSNTVKNAITLSYLRSQLTLKRDMSNHDSLSKLKEKSYNSLTDKPRFSLIQDYPYSSVLSLDSGEVIFTAGKYLKLIQKGNELVFESDTNYLLTKFQAQINGIGFVKANGTSITYDTNHFSSIYHKHTGVYEPVITAGVAGQYWDGTKTWQTLPVGLKVTHDTPNSSVLSTKTDGTDDIILTAKEGLQLEQIGNEIGIKNTGLLSVSNDSPNAFIIASGNEEFTLAGDSGILITKIGNDLFFKEQGGWRYAGNNLIQRVAGNVGFGTAAPVAPIHVVGATHFGGVTYTWPETDGTNDQTLTTNGSGQLSWTTKIGTVTNTGITSLAGQSGTTQSFANGTNVTMSSSGNTHTLGWTGQLNVSGGGTGASTLTGLLLGNGTSAFTAITDNSASWNKAYDSTSNGRYIPKWLIDAAGDLIVGTGNNTVSRLSLGANRTFLRSIGSTFIWDTIADAGANSRGLLKSADWNTFNDKVSFPGFGTDHAHAAYGDHAHSGYESALGNPLSSGYVLTSTSAGVRSWTPQTVGMVYPSIGIATSSGSGWGTSITDNSGNWNTAYGWGDHSGLYSPIAHKNTEDALNGIVKVNGAGVYSAITDNSGNWDAAYGWGNHSTQGYITDGNTNWDNIYGYITDGNTGWDNSYGFITGVTWPATYTPTAHTQAISTITNLQDSLNNIYTEAQVNTLLGAKQNVSDTSLKDATRYWTGQNFSTIGHAHAYDNYGSWSLVANGYNDAVTSGTNVTITPGTGIYVQRYAPRTLEIRNTAPDQTVTFAASGTFTVTGTYPNFTGIGTGIPADSLAFIKNESVVSLRDETDSVRIGTGSTDAVFDVNGSVSLLGGNGDLNNSGGINSTDILLLQFYLAYKYQLTKSEISNGDIGAKGYLNFLDTELMGKVVSSEISLDSARELSHWIRSSSISYSTSGNVGIGTTIAPAEKLEVVGNALVSDTVTVGSTTTNVTITDEDVTGPNFKITPEGGYAIRLVSGDSLLQGDVVYVSEGVAYRPEAIDAPIVGVVYANADVEESVWVVVSGIAYVRHFDPVYSGQCAYLDGENYEYVCTSADCAINLCGISTNIIPASVGTWIETDSNTGTSAKARCIINIRHAIYESCP